MDKFEAVLDESISALQAGVPLEEILAEAPDYAQELRPLLYAAMVLADPDPALVPAERKEVLRHQYLAQAAELPSISPTWGDKTKAVLHIVRRRFTKQAFLNDLVTITVTATLTLIMAVFILGFASQNTVPGDLLYSVKRISESVQLTFASDEERREMLALDFQRERLSEIEQLMRQNRAAAVQFEGTLDTQGENLWVIQGLTVFLPDEGILIEGDPQEGEWVRVFGFLRTDSVLIADKIEAVEVTSP